MKGIRTLWNFIIFTKNNVDMSYQSKMDRKDACDWNLTLSSIKSYI